MVQPPRRITDPTFKYTNAASTDLKKTFARVRREQKEAEELRKKVVPIKPVAPLEPVVDYMDQYRPKVK